MLARLAGVHLAATGTPVPIAQLPLN